MSTAPIHNAVATGIEIPAISASKPPGPLNVTTDNGANDIPNPAVKKMIPTSIKTIPISGMGLLLL